MRKSLGLDAELERAQKNGIRNALSFHHNGAFGLDLPRLRRPSRVPSIVATPAQSSSRHESHTTESAGNGKVGFLSPDRTRWTSRGDHRREGLGLYDRDGFLMSSPGR